MDGSVPGATHLGSDFGWSEEACNSYKAKASAFRGLGQALKDAKLLDDVLPKLPVPTAEILQKPPLSVSFMKGIHFQYVIKAIHEIGGDDLVYSIARDSILKGSVNMMRPLIEGTLRLFGASPNAFFKKVPQILGGQVTGMTFGYGSETADTAWITVRFEELDDVPPRTWVYWAGVFSSTYALCGLEGTCTPSPTNDPRGREAIIRCAWQKA